MNQWAEQTLELIRNENYLGAFTCEPKMISQDTDLFSVPRVCLDKSHSFREFKYLASPSVLAFKNIVGKFINGVPHA